LFHDLGLDALNKNVDVEDIIALTVREKIGRAKYIEEINLDSFDNIETEIRKEYSDLLV
jgi:V/A-type H+-transporting ATPase subunit A